MLRFVAMILFAACTPALSQDDWRRVDKSGFILDYHGNGGNCTGCEWLVIEGPIPPDAATIFKEWMVEKKLAGIPLAVNLNSDGGSLLGGIRLGKAIRELGLRTYVAKSQKTAGSVVELPGRCLSACVYAFLGGVSRHAKPNEIGVHQFYQDAFFQRPLEKEFSAIDFSLQQVLTGLLLNYVIEMGADPLLVIEATRTLPNAMKMLDADELIRTKVNFDPETYSPWTVEEYRGGVILVSRTADEQRQMTLFCTKSKRFELVLTFRKDADKYASVFSEIKNFSIREGDLIPRETIKISRQDMKTAGQKNLVLRVPVPAATIEAIAAKPLTVAFSAHEDEPRYRSGMFYEFFPKDNLQRLLRIATKNCIQ